jgi:hypothetical protein
MLLSWLFFPGKSTTAPISLTQVEAVRRCRKLSKAATSIPGDFKGEGPVTVSENNFSDEETWRPMKSLLTADERK